MLKRRSSPWLAVLLLAVGAVVLTVAVTRASGKLMPTFSSAVIPLRKELPLPGLFDELRSAISGRTLTRRRDLFPTVIRPPPLRALPPSGLH